MVRAMTQRSLIAAALRAAHALPTRHYAVPTAASLIRQSSQPDATSACQPVMPLTLNALCWVLAAGVSSLSAQCMLQLTWWDGQRSCLAAQEG